MDDPTLGKHQVALMDLYVEIPFTKDEAIIKTWKTDEFIFVEIRNKYNEKILYNYGESLNERLLFRELQKEKSRIRLEARVDADTQSGKIIKVNNTRIFFHQESPGVH